MTRLELHGKLNVYIELVLEKHFNRSYNSGWLNDGRVLKLHREAARADASVQLARIKNWRRPNVSIFFSATFHTRLNVLSQNYYKSDLSTQDTPEYSKRLHLGAHQIGLVYFSEEVLRKYFVHPEKY